MVDHAEDVLLTSNNPFALVTLAQLAENNVSNLNDERYAVKLRLIHLLLERGYDKTAIRNLLIFIDWILRLSPALEKKIWLEVAETTENTMQYIPSWERLAKAEGREEGLELAIFTVFESRFDEDVSLQTQEKIRDLKEESLRELLVFSSVAKTLSDVIEFLATL